MMTENNQLLPWDALAATEGQIPWQVINTFADALAAEPALWVQLAKRYDAVELIREYRGYEDLYIPAIFAQASGRLSMETKRQIGPYLLEKLSEAGYQDDEIGMEVFSAACGSLGPVILPDVMDFIDREENTNGAWIFLWSLLQLAKQAEDEVRTRVINFCVEVLTLADQGQVPLIDVEFIPEILVHLNCREYLDLLKRLAKKAKGSHSYVEFNASIQELMGNKAPVEAKEMWETPVEEWLPWRWDAVKKWHEKNQTASPEEEQGESERFRMELIRRRFLRSEAGRKAIKEYLDDVPFITDALLNYLWDYQEVCFEEINQTALEKVLLDLFPRKVIASRKELENVAPVVSAFLRWLHAQGILSQGENLAKMLEGWSEQIVIKGMNPKYWSIGKAFSMQAQADGVDLTDKTEADRYLHYYNTHRLGSLSENHSDPWDQQISRAPIPIHSTESKTGRNQPCPCGSGKKFKNAAVQ